jgi:hypothetical protein
MRTIAGVRREYRTRRLYETAFAVCAADAHGKEFRNELSNRVDKLRER